MITKTELEWSYEPDDFFESPLKLSLENGQLNVDAGKAVYRLATPNDPIPLDIRESVSEEVSRVFKCNQIRTHRVFTIRGPSVTQLKANGSRNTEISVESATLSIKAGRADIISTDKSGNIVVDSEAARIRSETAFISSLLPRIDNSPTLQNMVDSYSQAVQDPDDEFVHLYEICDAAVKHYGNEASARTALGISLKDWRTFKGLANNKHIRQSRHRGQQEVGLRDATPEELADVRRVARHIIEAFARLS